MSELPAPDSDQAPLSVLDPRRWWILGVLCLSLLIIFIGNTSLNVAIPTLSRELQATESQLQWVIASYSLVFAGLLFSTGAVGDRFGRKGALQFGLLVFLVGVVSATFATDMWQLIACRALMGVGAAFIMPSTLSILVNVFPPEERTKAIAIWAGVTGAAGAVGPLLSGWILGHFWYGAVFLVNVPFILLGLVAGWFLLPKSKDPQQGKLDPVGAVLSVIGISALVYGLIEAPERGWTGGVTLAAFAVSLVVLAAFVAWELHTEEPMLDMSFFRNPAFSTSTAGMILVFLSMYGVMFLVTQYFQLVLGYSALESAVRLLPMAPIMMVVAPLTPRLSARYGANRTVGFGLVLVSVGLFLFRGVGIDTAYAFILFSLFPLVGGIALAMSPMTAAIMSAVPPRRAGAGSAMNDATRELGAALGVAVMGSVAASHYGSKLAELTVGLPAEAQEAAGRSLAGALQTAAQLPGEAGAALARGADLAFIDGVHMAVTVGSVLTLVAAALVTAFLPRQLAHQGAAHGPVEAAEDVAELGLAGVPPVFPDTPVADPAPDDDLGDDDPRGVGPLEPQPA